MGEDERLEGQNDCQMCIDLPSSVVPSPATHNRWRDFWDVGVRINDEVQKEMVFTGIGLQ